VGQRSLVPNARDTRSRDREGEAKVIGWNSTQARDADEAITNGLCDEDLGGLEASLKRRRDALMYPTCPSCGEALKEPHVHDGVLVAPVGWSPAASSADRWPTLVKTVLDAMAPPKRQDPPPRTPQDPLP
jgi:hypothetical protein